MLSYSGPVLKILAVIAAVLLTSCSADDGRSCEVVADYVACSDPYEFCDLETHQCRCRNGYSYETDGVGCSFQAAGRVTALDVLQDLAIIAGVIAVLGLVARGWNQWRRDRRQQTIAKQSMPLKY